MERNYRFPVLIKDVYKRQAFEDTIQTGDFAELPIHYLYVASGNFDFALPGQVQDYQALLDIEPRLRSGDVYKRQGVQS